MYCERILVSEVHQTWYARGSDLSEIVQVTNTLTTVLLDAHDFVQSHRTCKGVSKRRKDVHNHKLTRSSMGFERPSGFLSPVRWLSADCQRV